MTSRIVMPRVAAVARQHEVDVNLARLSHQLSAATLDKTVSTSLRLLIVLNVLFKYASAR